VKAWIVSEGDLGDGNCIIVFAETRNEARNNGRSELDREYMEVTATRKKEYDKYAEQGEVPCDGLIKDGWWFTCYGDYCYRNDNIDQEAIDHDGARIIDGKPYCGKCVAEIDRLQRKEAGTDE
jgi:hypothetical protein